MDGWESQWEKRCGPTFGMERKIEEAIGKLHHLSSFLFFEILFKLQI
jgi:hypothetical protein